MKRITVVLALLTALTIAVSTAIAIPPTNVVYDATPSPLPPNMASLGFQATQTSEFGDYVHLYGADRVLKTVTVTMSDWALYSDYASDARYLGDSVNWTHPITLNVYADSLDTNGVPDTLLATVTETITIPWRPVADPTCSNGTAWRADDDLCYNGLVFNATFDFSSLDTTLPDDVIIGVAYNTQSYGSAPIGVSGPYNSLNVGAVGAATVGTDDNVDNVFWNTSTAAWYTDGGTGGVGIFREDTNWTTYGTIPIQITGLRGPGRSADQQGPVQGRRLGDLQQPILQQPGRLRELRGHRWGALASPAKGRRSTATPSRTPTGEGRGSKNPQPSPHLQLYQFLFFLFSIFYRVNHGFYTRLVFTRCLIIQ